MRTAAVLALALAASAAACKSHHEARVGAALLPQANATTPAPAGVPQVAIVPGTTVALPTGPVALAIDVNVPWAQVRDLVFATPAPTLLVGDFHRIRAFRLEDELDPGPALRVDADGHGKFCVRPPGVDTAYCLESSDRNHISAAFVREVMRDAVAEYGMAQARVRVTPDIRWADLVRTVDGTRTCCRQPVKVDLAR